MSDNKVKMIFGSNVKFYLNKNRMSQADFYRALNSSSGAVSDWINGNKLPGTETIERIAELFHVPISELFVDRDALSYDDVDKAALSYYNYLTAHPKAHTIADLMMGFDDNELDFLYTMVKKMKTNFTSRSFTEYTTKREV